MTLEEFTSMALNGGFILFLNQKGEQVDIDAFPWTPTNGWIQMVMLWVTIQILPHDPTKPWTRMAIW